MGKVIFVGAGPGDPELITIKGIHALRRADVVLYDALVSPELLQHTAPTCRKVFVGKRKGRKEFEQDTINQLLVFYASRYSTVVRLKGGDPYVFGRGHEEMEFVTGHGIPCETVPGISSALAAPSAATIPLTKRGINESFWVVTGTLASGRIATDLPLAARSSATIIILMGLSHLSEIASLVCEVRSPEEPMAVIQQATLPSQKVVTGTASDITALATIAGVAAPAVIVIGKVVRERKAMLNHMEWAISTTC